MTWFRFDDRHSGGFAKTPWEYIFIEADCEAAARYRFEWIFGWTSYAESCGCCGEDYFCDDVEGPDGGLVLPIEQEDLTDEQATQMDAFGARYEDDWKERVGNRAYLAERNL